VEPGKVKIEELLRDASTGKLVLPEFQRSFVWSRRDIEELLVSVANDYFIGTLLLLDIDPESPPFAPRLVEGVSSGSTKPERMLLDGQQRITSLYYAFNELDFPLSNTAYPYRFFLSIEKALSAEWDDAVFSVPVRSGEPEPLASPVDQFSEHILPFTALRSWSKYDEWQHDYRLYLEKNGKYNPESYEKFRHLTRGLLDYEVPYVRLPRNTDLEKVVEVFERINRTGTPLSLFALVSARLYKDNVKLRDLWDGTYDEHPEIRRISDQKDENFPRILLQIVSLMRGRECRRKHLIMLDHRNFDTDWRIAAKYANSAMGRLFHLAEGGYGVLDPSWLPYSTIVAPLAALLLVAETKYKGTADAYDCIHKWYWNAVFSERYAGSSDTVVHSDYNEVAKWFSAPSVVPEGIRRSQTLVEHLNLDRSSRGAVYKGLMCLIALCGPKDFLSGDPIDLHEVDDHHIFPKSLLKGKYDDETINVVLNRTLITRTTNQDLVRNKKPSVYLSNMESSLGVARTRQVLRTHLIDEKAIGYMRNDDFEGFCKQRKEVMLSEIGRRCGIG